MGSTAIDMTGQRLGRLIALRRTPAPTGRRSNGGAWWLCRCDCGREWPVSRVNLQSGRTRGCGCRVSRAVPDRKQNSYGYVRAYAPEHPRANGAGRVYEHILVMEQVLGRRLLPGENVHHMNGIRHDNRPENLELWSVSQPPGQRVADRVSWALGIVRQYCPELLKEDAWRTSGGSEHSEN